MERSTVNYATLRNTDPKATVSLQAQEVFLLQRIFLEVTKTLISIQLQLPSTQLLLWLLKAKAVHDVEAKCSLPKKCYLVEIVGINGVSAAATVTDLWIQWFFAMDQTQKFIVNFVMPKSLGQRDTVSLLVKAEFSSQKAYKEKAKVCKSLEMPQFIILRRKLKEYLQRKGKPDVHDVEELCSRQNQWLLEIRSGTNNVITA